MLELNMKTESLSLLIEIGKKESCTHEEFISFFPNFPRMGNSELFTSINGREFGMKRTTNDDLYYMIKGYHIIEKHYRELLNDKMGFGSPSKVITLIGIVGKFDQARAIELYDWVAFNGGNYYIEPNVTYREKEEIKRIKAKRAQDILENDKKIHGEAVLRRKRVAEEHTKLSKEAKEIYLKFQEKIENMDDANIINLFNELVDTPSHGAQRSREINAIRAEFDRRKFDYTSIGGPKIIKVMQKVQLLDKKIALC